MKLLYSSLLLLLSADPCRAKTLRGGESQRDLERRIELSDLDLSGAPTEEGTQEPTEPFEPTEGPEEETQDPEEETQPPIGLVKAEDDEYIMVQGQKLKIKNPGFLENDIFEPTEAGLFVSSWSLVEPFSGSLDKIDNKADGSFEYTPAYDFIGTETFEYTACLILFPVICDSAMVVINVVLDTAKPDAVPIAQNDFYTILAGEKLSIYSPGILSNDQVGNPANPLKVCDTDESNINQDLTTYSKGGFTYKSKKCWSGTETFTYQACYQNYPEMISNWATVTIQVDPDTSRPSAPPNAVDVSYSVQEGDTLEIGSGGLFSNSASGSLSIDEWSRSSSFVGSLKVNKDGSFKYTAISGGLGTQEFTFTVCYSDWDCVDCSTATARITVITNPNKPLTPPQAKSNTIQVVQGELYRANVKNSLVYDERYTLAFGDFQTPSDFSAILNTDKDGSFAYGNAPVGNNTFTYRACYKEWPDLCSTIQVTMDTKSGAPVYIGSPRRGVATNYQISWAGNDNSGGCVTTEPRVTLSCGGEGEISLIDSGLPSDNDMCKTEPITGSIVCAAQQAGVVFAECRDGTSVNPVNRMMISQLYSNAVACGSTTVSPPYRSYHMAGLKTWCEGEWVDRTSTCSGVPLQHDSLGKVCSAEHSTETGTAQPASLTMMSADFNGCVVTGSTLVPAPSLPVLQVVSNPTECQGICEDRTDVITVLSECQGSCTSHSDCDGDLVCFQRQATEVVPGCILPSSGEAFKGTNFCIQPVTGPTSFLTRSDGNTGNATMEIIGDADGKPHPMYPLLECQADCDYDWECMGELICSQRSKNETVPGCTGDKPEFQGQDFCIRPLVITPTIGNTTGTVSVGQVYTQLPVTPPTVVIPISLELRNGENPDLP